MELENIVDNLIAILKELPEWTEISVWELLKTIDDKKYTTKEMMEIYGAFIEKKKKKKIDLYFPYAGQVVGLPCNIPFVKKMTKTKL